ncbi:MAG: DsbA family oxidoreductase [Gammaproteobacteria bacterium]|nr:DsbA family oxidoreductase [Gammaproteobacteria bacterium]
MPAQMKIDFVSDVSCPWCIIGLRALEDAIARIGPELEVEFEFQPFELNPQMPAEGQDLDEHIMQKYGMGPADTARNREAIRARGAELGFEFRMDKRDRIYNTFDAHRLLTWAHGEGKQRELKHALFDAYFTQGLSPGDHAVLLSVAESVGLDAVRAAAVLASDEFAEEVRAREGFYHQHGIHAVPAIILNERHLLQGGQPTEVFEQALREIAAKS